MNHYLASLPWLLVVAAGFWVYSLVRNNVNSVDTLWSLMFLLVTGYCLAAADAAPDNRSLLVLGLVLAWSLRLAGHLLVRNWGHAEDRRYRRIRANNEPNFGFKSLYLVFGLQAVLAWVIAMPLVVASRPGVAFGWLDLVAVALWLTGWLFETVADWQLQRYRSRHQGGVLDTGLWRFTRHPNYFGEFCIWWAFYLLAVPAGGWWTIYSPILMTILLLRVSGVALMEQEISEHRPDYEAYKARTSAFFPRRPLEKEVLS